MNIEKQIKNILSRFSHATGLPIRIQTFWILASLDQPYDASITIKVGNVEYPFWIIHGQHGPGRKRSNMSPIENVIHIGEFSMMTKRGFLEKKMPYIASDGTFSIPLTLTNSTFNEKPLKERDKGTETLKSEKIYSASIGKAKFIHFILETRNAAKRTQRLMADETGVSLAAVNKYLKELESSNYIINDNKRIRFIDPGKILELWTADYLRKILPRVEKHTFDPYDDKQYRDLRTKAIILKNGYWSGVKAADALVGSEFPDRFIIYSDHPQDVAKELRLRPTKAGKIEIRKKFWKFDWKEKSQGIVDLPLIYADLMDSGDPRDLKIAKDIKEKWISHL